MFTIKNHFPMSQANATIITFFQTLRLGLQTAMRINFASWLTTLESVATFLSLESDRRARSWAKAKLAELDSVGATMRYDICSHGCERDDCRCPNVVSQPLLTGVVLRPKTQGAILIGVVSAALAWQDLANLYWAARGSWFGGIFINSASFCLATNQSLILYRLSCCENSGARIRAMLGTGLRHTEIRK